MRRVTRLLRANALAYGCGLALLPPATALAMALPWLAKRAVDAIAAGVALPAVVPALAAIAAVACAQAAARIVSRRLLFGVACEVEHRLRSDVFAHLARLPVAFFQEHPPGDLVSRLLNDAVAVRVLLGPGIVNCVTAPLSYAIGLAAMGSISVPLTCAALAFHPVAALVVRLRARRLMDRTLRAQRALGDVASRVQETLSGMHVVKAYAAEAHAVRQFAATNARYRDESLRLARLRAVFEPLMGLVAGAGMLVVVWYGGRLVVAGRMTVGDLVAFTGYLGLLAVPTTALGWLVSVVQRANAGLVRLDELLQTPVAIASPQGATPPAACRGDVAFRNVTFRYPGCDADRPALDRIDLTIPAGARVAVVGRTGAGKSTLVQLLARLWDVGEGSVLVDGHDVRTLPLDWLRGQVGLVTQDPFLFSRTIRENVAFAAEAGGRRGPAAVDWALAAAGLARDLDAFPAGADTVVGERGATLSGGQKQRATLARVLATSPRILVLDDALSGVDASTESEVLRRLRTFSRGRTTIFVAHRLTTVKEADFIVVLDGGRVVEVGDHRRLLARGGVYAELFREQAANE